MHYHFRTVKVDFHLSTCVVNVFFFLDHKTLITQRNTLYLSSALKCQLEKLYNNLLHGKEILNDIETFYWKKVRHFPC